MAPIRYRRTSLKTALGVTKVEKEIKRELGITALLKPFRWWGNEKRTLKRDVGYYSPEAKFVRHFFPHAGGMLVRVAALILSVLFALGWYVKSTNNQSNVQTAPPNPPASGEWTTATIHASGNVR